MKQAKFRFWCEQTEQYIDDFIISQDGSVCSFDGSGVASAEYGELERLTGLTDKNGLDIYEGDIIKSHFYDTLEWEEVADISYCSHKAKFVFNDGEGEQDAFVEGMEIGVLEVIGNIHQNSELLK